MKKRYTTLLVRPNKPLLHDEECTCEPCSFEVSERQRAHRMHTRTIRCVECKAYIKVNGRGGLNARRERAIERHFREVHGAAMTAHAGTEGR